MCGGRVKVELTIPTFGDCEYSVFINESIKPDHFLNPYLEVCSEVFCLLLIENTIFR